MLNVHPSLLPAYRGLHTHRRVLAAGRREHGASVHYVTPSSTAGRWCCSRACRCGRGHRGDTRRARAGTEHVIYPRVIGWVAPAG